MKLDTWLQTRKPKMTQDAFGMKVGLSQGRISQIVKNGTGDLATALRIVDATGGDVSLRDLLPERATAEPAPSLTTGARP